MAKKRDTYRYRLKDGNKVVFIGITDDPERRAREHNSDGKKFNRFEVVGPKVTSGSAEDWEKNSLKTYLKGHRGKNPKYNKT